MNIVTSTEYNKTATETKSMENTVFVPILGMSITRNGKCNIKDDTNLQTDYSVINNVNCPRDQAYHDFYSEDLFNILNFNDNYYNYLDSNLPMFSQIVNTNVKWSLGIKYAFYRNTIGCLLSEYSRLNQNNAFSEYRPAQGKNATNYEKKIFQLRNILSVFINFNLSYTFQNNIQISILIINCSVVFFNVSVIFFKIFRICCNCPEFVNIFIKYEGTFSFILDFSTAILGGTSYFIIDKFITLINNLLDTDCVDNRVQYQFGVFNDALDSTSEQNFQIFIFMVFKLFFLFFSTFYYMIYKKCNFRWNSLKRVIMENVNEGEDEMDLESLTEKEEKSDIKDNSLKNTPIKIIINDLVNNNFIKNKTEDDKNIKNEMDQNTIKKDDNDNNNNKNQKTETEMININSKIE